MQKLVPILAALLASSITGCRPRPSNNSKALGTPTESQPLNCDTTSRPPANENVVTANETAAKIMSCAQRLLAPATLTTLEDAAATKLFEGFVGSGCDGCHSGKSSFGGLAQFVSNEGAGREEFLRGIALRHQFSRKIIETCVNDSPGQQALLRVFTKRRHLSEARLRYELDGKSYESRAGIPFFTPGTDHEMRSQVMSFLQGGFEIAAKPGDDLHETVLAFIATGGRLSLETHICIIRDALISVARQGDLTIK